MTDGDMKASADNTAQEQRGVPFKAGQSGNPKGRPKGSRNKLSEAFLSALDADFELHGPDVITKVRIEKPDVYLKVVANLMPARLEAQLEAKVEHHHLHQLESASSVDEILEWVAGEAGPENAIKLAEVFALEPPTEARRSYHPPECYNENGQPVYCRCDDD